VLEPRRDGDREVAEVPRADSQVWVSAALLGASKLSNHIDLGWWQAAVVAFAMLTVLAVPAAVVLVTAKVRRTAARRHT
jgi:hypothetical protein